MSRKSHKPLSDNEIIPDRRDSCQPAGPPIRSNQKMTQTATTSRCSDDDLIRAYVGGDQQAFIDLLRRHGDALLGYLVRFCPSREEAEDVFQETFRRVHQNAGSFSSRCSDVRADEQGGRFRSWLYTIATNVAVDGYRRQQRRPSTISLQMNVDRSQTEETELAGTLADEKAATPEKHVLLDEVKQKVRQAIVRLPEKQRATLVMSYYQKLSYKEIAEILDCTIGTVKSHMFRAVRTLADLLPDMKDAVL